MNTNHCKRLKFEPAFAILGILFFSSSIPIAFIPLSINSLIKYVLLLGSIILLSLRWQSASLVARRSVLVWCVSGLSIASVLWSQNPAETQFTIREVIQMNAFGLYFASQFKLKEQLSLVAYAFGIVALTSLFLAIAMPTVGIDQTIFVGAWRGVYTHKNGLGKMMSFSVAVFSLIIADRQFHQSRVARLLTLGGLFLSFGLVILSTSKTSLSISLISVLLLYGYRLYQKQGRKRSLYLEIGLLAFMTSGLVISSSLESILTSMGKDLTLTGRTEIWGVALFLVIQQNPLLGFGRGTFWAAGSPLAQLAGTAAGNQYVPPHSHNGYIDLTLEIGLLGLFLFLLSFIFSYRHAITRSFISGRAKDAWPMVALSWLFLYNFTESSLLNGANIFWPLYIAAALCAKPAGRVIYLQVSTPEKGSTTEVCRDSRENVRLHSS